MRFWNRSRDQSTVQSADNVLIYDDRLRKPVQDIYDVEPELISPVAAIGQGKTTDPDNKILAVGPYEPLQNIKRIIDAFYLFVNRLGTQRRDDWDGRNPMQMWQSGDFKLNLHGAGDGKSYLKDYAESQQLEDQIEFPDWIVPENLERELESALAVIDVPLGGDASTVAYHAIAMGVPTVHTRHHQGIDTLIENSDLSLKTKSTDDNHIARNLLNAVRVPTSSRQPVESLRNALDVESGVNVLREKLNADT
jgi:glycosyltransferase involved in cell wall biosynthesis